MTSSTSSSPEETTVFHSLTELKTLLALSDDVSLEPLAGYWQLFTGSGSTRTIIATADPGYNKVLNRYIIDADRCLADTAAYSAEHEFTRRTAVFLDPACGHDTCRIYLRCAGCYAKYAGVCAERPANLRKASWSIWRSASASPSPSPGRASPSRPSPVPGTPLREQP